jgi:hypothetical protein
VQMCLLTWRCRRSSSAEEANGRHSLQAGAGFKTAIAACPRTMCCQAKPPTLTGASKVNVLHAAMNIKHNGPPHYQSAAAAQRKGALQLMRLPRGLDKLMGVFAPRTPHSSE